MDKADRHSVRRQTRLRWQIGDGLTGEMLTEAGFSTATGAFHCDQPSTPLNLVFQQSQFGIPANKVIHIGAEIGRACKGDKGFRGGGIRPIVWNKALACPVDPRDLDRLISAMR